MREAIGRLAVLVVVAVLLVQGAMVGFVAGSQSVGDAQVGPDGQLDDGPESADDVYVEDDGDAVLVYEADGDASAPNRTEFGVDVAENIAYLLVTDPVEETPEVTGNLSVGADRSEIEASGDLAGPRPDWLEALEVTASGTRTADEGRSEVTATATILDEFGASGAVESVATNGSMTTSADRFTLDGALDADANAGLSLGEDQSLALSLTENDEGYHLSLEESRVQSTAFGSVPRNESAARAALEAQYGALAESLGGSATVELDAYDVTEDGSSARVERAYAVQFTGVDEGLQSQLRTSLGASPDVTDERADRLAGAVGAVEVSDVSLEYEVGDAGVTGNVSVDVENYADLATAYFELVSAFESEAAIGQDIEQAREQFEAQQASGLERHFDWDGSLERTDVGEVGVELSTTSRSDNWEAYVEELRDRDVPFLEQEYSLEAGLEDERVVAEGSATVTGEDVIATHLDQFPDQARSETTGPSVADALAEANPETAKLEAAYDADGLRIEAGAAFEDLAVLRDAVAERGELPPAHEVVGRMDGGEGETVVRVSDAVEGETTASEIRALPVVDEETTVHEPGEWDREFATMDVERAEAFLADDGGDGPSPVLFVAGAGVFAVAAAGLFVVYRS